MRTRSRCCLVLLLFLFTADGLFADALVYSTWDDFEVDKLASIWLLKRFIAPGAKIEIYPKGRMIKKGIEFDTPYASLGRSFNRAAFEALLENYKMKDEKLVKMAKIIHDIEINVWQKKIFKKSRQIEQDVIQIINNDGSNDEIMEKAFKYFNVLYEEMQ